jgi:hypothetical protein
MAFFGEILEGIESVFVIAETADEIVTKGTKLKHAVFGSGDNPQDKTPAKNTYNLRKRRFVPDSTDDDTQHIDIYHKGEAHSSSNPGENRGVPLPSEEQMLPSGKAGYGTGDHEVDVIPPPKRLALACPDYFTIDMHICETGTWSLPRVSASFIPQQLLSFRCNSIYDPVNMDNRSVKGVEFPLTHQPMGRDTWAAIYQYYRVLSADIDIAVVNKSSFNSTVGESEAIIAGIEWIDTDSSSGLAQTLSAFMEEKNCNWKVIQPTPRNVSGGGGVGGVAHFKYHYTPDSWDYHIQNSSEDTRWTPIAQSPPQSHIVSLSYFPFIPGVAATTTYSGEVTFKVKYTVQFRESNYSIINTSC